MFLHIDVTSSSDNPISGSVVPCVVVWTIVYTIVSCYFEPDKPQFLQLQRDLSKWLAACSTPAIWWLIVMSICKNASRGLLCKLYTLSANVLLFWHKYHAINTQIHIYSVLQTSRLARLNINVIVNYRCAWSCLLHFSECFQMWSQIFQILNRHTLY